MNKCGIVKDLFTAYVSGVGSEETRSLVEEHINTCEDCRTKLEEVQNKVAVAFREKDAKSINMFKTMKKKIFRRNVLVGVTAVVVVAIIALFVGFKVIEETPIAYYDGMLNVRVNYADYYKNDDNISVIITDPNNQPPEALTSSGKVPVLDISCTRKYYSSKATGRTIMRDGERVNLEYICYYENSLTKQTELLKDEEQSFYRLTHFVENDGLQTPIKCEVYYVTDIAPITDITKNPISDKDFDDYRLNGTLVWSGMVE